MTPIRLWLVIFAVLMAGHAYIACLVPSPSLAPPTPRSGSGPPKEPIVEPTDGPIVERPSEPVGGPVSPPLPEVPPMPPVRPVLPETISGAHLFVVVETRELRAGGDGWNALFRQLRERGGDLAGGGVWFVGRQTDPAIGETVPTREGANADPSLSEGLQGALKLIARADRKSLKRVSILWVRKVNPDSTDLKAIDWKKFPSETTVIRCGDNYRSETLSNNGIYDQKYPDFPINLVGDLYPGK